VKTFKLNRPWVPVYHGQERWPLTELRDRDVDLLYANPPCAIVSVCGRCLKEGPMAWRTDPRTQRVRDIAGLTLAIRPKVMAMESVVQMYTRARELLEEQAGPLREAGYTVSHLLVNNGWHGVPQTRKRYYLLAHRVPLGFERLNYAPPSTVGEVLREVVDPGYIPPMKPEIAALHPELKQGRGVRHLWESKNPPETWVRTPVGVKGRPRMLEGRLRSDRTMGVFYGDFFWHPELPRRLGLEEAKAFCGFPADWKFHHPGAAYSELARGVMPDMGGWLARQVANSLEGQMGGRELPLGEGGVLDLRKPPQ
jgi:site-specific DNA-cytosine methylase